MAHQTDLKRTVGVDWDRESNDAARLTVDVMATIDAKKLPAVSLDEAREFAA